MASLDRTLCIFVENAREFFQAMSSLIEAETSREVFLSRRDEFEQHYAEGEYDTLLPKKYQSGSSLHKQEMARLATMGFYKGERVSMHPATDAFMMGDRYGNVVKVGQKLVHVKMDRSGKIRKVSPGNLEHVY